MSREYQSVLPRSRSPLSRLSINPRSEASPNKSSIKQISLKRLESNDIDAFIEKLQSNR